MQFITISLFAIIIIISFYQSFIKNREAYSINKFLWVYILIFWAIVPLVQYRIDIFPWNIKVSEFNAIKANMLILLWIVFYILSYNTFKRKELNIDVTVLSPQVSLKPSSILLLLSIQFLILLFFYLISGGFVFLRGDFDAQTISGTQSTYLIINQLLRASTTFCTIIFAYYYKSTPSRKRLIILLLSLFLLIFTNFPLAIPRYMAGAFYIAIVFVLMPDFKHKSLPTIGLAILIFIIYPALSVFRVKDQSVNDIQVSLAAASFLTGDFDNYATLNMVIDYVNKHSITYGSQLLGVLFFFVPRSIWLSKPIGSGAFVAESNNWSFTNISCSYVAEGYLNFGFIGVIIFAIILGYTVSKLDAFFYHSKKLNFIKIFYPVSLGMIFFILRGDLMSSFAFTTGFIIAAVIIATVIRLRIIIKKDNIMCMPNKTRN